VAPDAMRYFVTVGSTGKPREYKVRTVRGSGFEPQRGDR